MHANKYKLSFLPQGGRHTPFWQIWCVGHSFTVIAQKVGGHLQASQDELLTLTQKVGGQIIKRRVVLGNIKWHVY